MHLFNIHRKSLSALMFDKYKLQIFLFFLIFIHFFYSFLFFPFFLSIGFFYLVCRYTGKKYSFQHFTHDVV